LHRAPRRRLPRRARRLRHGVLTAGEKERGSPALVGVAGELEVVPLPDHAALDHADAQPRVEPFVEDVKDRRQRPLQPGARERDEHEPGAAVGYWITSSARDSSDCGIVRPSALAVLRLMTSSNFVGCSTGRSAGFAPLRILSTYAAVRARRSSIADSYAIRPPGSTTARYGYSAGGLRRGASWTQRVR